MEAWFSPEKTVWIILSQKHYWMGKSKLLRQGDVNRYPSLESIFVTMSFQFRSDIKKNMQSSSFRAQKATKRVVRQVQPEDNISYIQ